MVADILEHGTRANSMAVEFMSMLRMSKSMVNGNMERESDGLTTDILCPFFSLFSL